MMFTKEVVSVEKREATVKDAILTIVLNEDRLNRKQLHYKLLQCGMYVDWPTFTRLVDSIIADGLIQPPGVARLLS